MKNFTRLFALLLLVSSLAISGCKKDENPAGGGGGNTSTGAGTMSAEIDGQDWSATTIPGSPIPGAYASYANNILVITGTRIEGTQASVLTITVRNVTGTGTFTLGNGVTSPGIGQFVNTAQQGWATTGEDGNSGTLEITRFDTENKIVAGTFQFRCVSTNATPATRNITEGRFDVKWGIAGGN